MRRGGELLQLETRVFDALAFLILHRDRVVSKQELLEHVWPDQFISDAAFDHCIMAVRKAVGDDGRAQRIVKTLRRRGYRFIAAVVAEEQLTREPLASPLVTEQGEVDCPAAHHHSGQGHFCPTCGAPLPVICPQCQRENAPGSKFCNACGTSLAQATPALLPAQLNVQVKATEPLSYTPRHLAEEILTTRSALEGERKQVTVLFCDLVGSTPLADRLGPEGMHALLNRFFEFALSAVHRYGGTINQFLGDGFMALFGAPLAQEDHTRRAVLAALELHQNIQGRPLELPPELGMSSPCLEVRMGLHMGTVVVGSIGDNLRMDYTAVGDTTHLAARLQQTAEPGMILISESASHLVQNDVLMEPLGAMVVKGKADAVSVYQVMGRSASRPDFDRGGRRRLTRFVGRQGELQALHEQFESVAKGQGRVVEITGEPGMGKSRLIHEFRRRMAATPALTMHAHCVSYGHTMPYLPVLDLLRHLCGLSDTDWLDITEDDIRRPLQALGLDPETWAVYLLHALGLKTATERLASLGSEVVKTRMFEILLSMCLGHSKQQPLIVVVEDLHWIDRSSEDFLSLLVEHIQSAAILLLLTYRPDYRTPWRGHAEITQIALQRLSPSDSLTVVHSVVQQKTFPYTLAQMILAKTDGNPLFLEELSRAVATHGDWRAENGVPDTIQGVLMARIDQLPDTAKRLLQTASVLGRTVSVPLLAAIWEAPEALDTALQALKQQDFLYEDQLHGELVYLFTHALTQEVAYESLLTSRRRRLHAAVGQALEAAYATGLEDAYDRLAYHYSKAEQTDKAITYLCGLAAEAVRHHAHAEAILALQDALHHSEKLPDEQARTALALDLHLRLAHSLYALGRYPEALTHLQEQQRSLEAQQDARLSGQYALLRSQTYTTLGDWAQAATSAQQALETAAQAADEVTMGHAYHVLAMERYWMGDPLQGAAYSRREIDILERAKTPYRLGMAHFVLGLNTLILGDFAAASTAVARVRQMGDDLGDAHLQTFAAWLSGWLHTTQGNWDAGIRACQQAFTTSSDLLNTAFALGWLGYAYVEKGEPEAAISYLEQAVMRMRQSGYRRLEGAYSTFLADAQRLREQYDLARDLARQGLDMARSETYLVGVGWAQRSLGHIAQAESNWAEAAHHLYEALTTFTDMQARFEVGRTHWSLAKLAEVQGDRERVTLHLTEAHHLFTVLRVPCYRAHTEALAASLGLSFAGPG